MSSTRTIHFDASAASISALRKPVRRIALEQDSHGRFGSVTLRHSDRSGLRIHSEMHDLAERLEVGVLRLEEFGNLNFSDAFHDFDVPLTPVAIWKLEIEEAGTRLESGLKINFSDHQEMIVVPSAFPCDIFALGPGLPSPIDQPEYPIEEYEAVQLA